MKILGTGLTGLVGSRIVELLSDKYQFENIGKSAGIDITNKNSVLEKIEDSDGQIILHLAAKTDVDECEKDKLLGQDGEAWKINVEGTRNIVDTCLRTKKQLIYISTDFVFDGTKDIYFEEDIPNPINWYAKTKYEGEKIVQEMESPWNIVRIAYPYRANFAKPDFFRTILNRLRKGEQIAAVTDHIFTPTYIDDIAFSLEVLINSNSQGIFHIVGNQSLTPFDATNLIADKFGLDKSKISKTTRSKFFNNRAPRPFQLALENDKIAKLGVRMRTFEEGTEEVLKQVQDDKEKI